jgi:hypothetical protein
MRSVIGIPSEGDMEARERESMFGRRTLRLERKASTRLNLRAGGKQVKSRTREYTLLNTSCSSMQKSSLSDRSNEVPLIYIKPKERVSHIGKDTQALTE